MVLMVHLMVKSWFSHGQLIMMVSIVMVNDGLWWLILLNNR